MATYLIPIYTQTAGSNVSSITFNNIPQTYQDLVIKVSSRRDNTAGGSGAFEMRFNGVSSGYSFTRIFSNTSSITSSRGSSLTSMLVGEVGESGETGWGTTDILVTNYSGNTFKPVKFDSVRENNAALTAMNLGSGLWSNIAAVTSITFFPTNTSSPFLTNTSISIYGIKTS